MKKAKIAIIGAGHVGGEIVNLLKTGSAYYAAASAAVLMIEAYLYDKKTINPCSAYIGNNEYGIPQNIYFGVPVRIGKNGAEEIIEFNLSKNEREQLSNSVQSVKALNEKAMRYLSPAQRSYYCCNS